MIILVYNLDFTKASYFFITNTPKDYNYGN